MVFALTTTIVPQMNPPNVTEVAPVKFTPLIVTGVPPRSVPELGEILVTVGNGDSSSVIVSVATEGVPRVRPPVGAESVRVTFSAPSMKASLSGVTVKVFDVRSFEAHES
jgi:hypothetical protein